MDGSSNIAICGFSAKQAVELNRCLGQHYAIFIVDAAEDVAPLLDGENIDLLLCRHSAGFNALDVLHQARIDYPDCVRLLAGDLDEAEHRRAIYEAAIYQFVPNDWAPAQIELLVSRALENHELAYRHRHLSHQLKIAEDVLQKHRAAVPETDGSRFEKLVYCSPGMAKLCNLARKAAKTNLPILIQGETGTGKELMARGIHYNSPRRERPLLVHNCGGMSDELLHSELFGHKRGAFTGAVSDRMGLFQAADGGTVFLDEISEVSPAFQVSLLRFLQEGEVKPLGSDKIIRCDVRIIAACNRPLDAMVSKGEFRQDLFFRLNGFQLNIPPLRKRTEDIEVLANYLLAKFAAEYHRNILGVAPGVMEKFRHYHWPGNVRELENEIKRMIAVSDNNTFLTDDLLSPHVAATQPRAPGESALFDLDGMTLKQKIEQMEAQIIAESLRRWRWNRSQVARELGLSRVGLSNKIKRYRLDPESAVA